MTRLAAALPSASSSPTTKAGASAAGGAKTASRTTAGANRGKNGDAAADKTLITTALRTLEKDMALLDNLAILQPQLSGTEVGLLLGAIAASGVGPIFFPGTSVTEVLAPAAAACE